MNEILGILTAVINSLWQAVVVAALVWTALRFWPRTNAATRYAIWWTTLAVVLILPAAPRFITTIRHHAVTSAAKPAGSATTVTPVPARVELFVIPPAPRRAARWPMAVLAIWAAIFAWRLYQIGRSYLYLRTVKRRATVSAIPLPEIPRRADLLISRDIASPMALGFVKPAVVLPDSLLAKLSDAEREHVLLHEAAHLARRDDWANLASRFLAGALALHPVAIWILWRIDREREIACDEWVVSRTGAARPYAKSLARLFDLLHGRGGQMLASGIFGRSKFGDRIEMLLLRGRPFTPQFSACAVIASAVTLSLLTVAGSLLPRFIAFAQTAPRLTYEVASIKRNTSGDQGDMHTGPPDAAGFNARNMTLEMLLKIAWRMKDSQIVGGPAWIRSERYDIDAKLPDGPISAQRSTLMLRSLLEDRFHLTLRHETRAIPVYALKGTLRPSPPETVPCVESGPNSPPDSRSPGEPPPTPCGGFVTGPNLIEGGNISMAGFTDVLGNFLDRPVLDRTGFTGRFTVRLDFRAEGTLLKGNNDSSQPSIFSAVQEYLGLTLESRKSPAEVLIVDHAERPDAN